MRLPPGADYRRHRPGATGCDAGRHAGGSRPGNAGFGEQMRQISLRFVPTAILSRQVGVLRKQALILNLPGQPKSIRETLSGLKDASGQVVVPGIFASVPYCIQLLEGPYIETNPDVVAAFRPKSAIRDIKS